MAKRRQEIDAKINYWRFRLFKILSLVGIIAGGITLIFSLNAAIQNNLRVLYYLDPAIYALWVLNSLVAWAPIRARFLAFLVMVYALGLALLLITGPYAGGLNWLLVFSLLAIVFFSAKVTYIALGINALTLAVLYSLFYFPELIPEALKLYGRDGFLAVSTNFLVINAVAIIPVGLMTNWLRKSVYNEIQSNERLKKERNALEKAKKQAEESDKLKSAFLNNISHEIRTPLNAITGFANLFEPGTDKDKQEQYAAIIRNNSDQLLLLIDNVIELSQLQSGSLPLTLRPLDVNTQLKQIYETWKEKLPESLTLYFKPFEDQSNRYVAADSHGLTRILNNLLDNAMKFTPTGWIELGCCHAPKNGILFYVEDTGLGISRDEKIRIFERFYKISQPRESFHSGTGMGLTLALNLSESMGGTMWLHSKPGKGSTFFVLLPEANTPSTQSRK